MSAIVIDYKAIASLEDWMQNPPERTEWVNEELIEKNGMTLKHSRIQSKISTYWTVYKGQGAGGEVYTEAPCRTTKQGRSPDVAYLTPDLVAQYGDAKVLPQSFPLIAEIISPTDFAEDAFEKVNEYLESGCQEVWLVLPESQWIASVTQAQKLLITRGDVAHTQIVLPGFSIAVNELFK